MPRKVLRRKLGRRPRKAAKKSSGRRLMPVGAIAAGGYAAVKGYRYYAARKGRLARANRARQISNLNSAQNIQKIPCGLTIGKFRKPSMQEKIRDATEEPILFRQTHAYKVNADSGRMNWFYSASLTGPTLMNFVNKTKDSSTDANTANTVIPDPTVAVGTLGVPQQFHKYLIKYNSVAYQLMNSSTNSLQGVVMWCKPKRELPSVFPGTTVPSRPCNMFAMAVNSAIPTQNVYNSGSYTQSGATSGFITSSLTIDYNRAGNTGTTNNTADNVLELDVGLRPGSSVCSNLFGYYFDVVKSTDFDLSPGQQAEFWLKQFDAPVLDFQATQFDSIPNVTYYCMIGFKGQMVGSNATTGDTTVVSTGSAQLSIIETHKTIMKPSLTRAPKIWNFINDAGETAPAGILGQIADANQEIINDETDGVDNTYNEVS